MSEFDSFKECNSWESEGKSERVLTPNVVQISAKKYEISYGVLATFPIYNND